MLLIASVARWRCWRKRTATATRSWTRGRNTCTCGLNKAKKQNCTVSFFHFQSVSRSNGQVKDSFHTKIRDRKCQSSKRKDWNVPEENHRWSMGYFTSETARKSYPHNQIGGPCEWRWYCFSWPLLCPGTLSRSVSVWTQKTRTGTRTLTPLSTGSGLLDQWPRTPAA